MLEHIFLNITRQRLNLVVLLLQVLFGPILVNVDARGRGGDYPNLALGKESYMVRLQDNLPLASNGNDGNLHVQVGDGVTSMRANMIIEVANPRFTVAGPHEAKLSLDGEELVVLPLEVAVQAAS